MNITMKEETNKKEKSGEQLKCTPCGLVISITDSCDYVNYCDIINSNYIPDSCYNKNNKK